MYNTNMKCNRCGGYRRNADIDIQKLRRRQAVGGPEDEAHVLIQLMRLGELDRYHVSLAAYLGDPAAIITSVEPWDDSEIPGWAQDWSNVGKVLRFGELEQRLLVWVAADIAEHVLPIFEDVRSGDDRPRLAIQAARSWVIISADAADTAADTAADAADAADAAAAYAAYVAAYAAIAANAANAAADAAAAAAAAADAAYFAGYAAGAAAGAAAYVAEDRDKEIAWQTKLVCDYLLGRRVVPPRQE